MKHGLAFSGGKDSFACLFLNKHRLSDIDVIFVNTGKLYPETLEMAAYAKTLCPKFHEVHSDRVGQNRRFGIPSDIVPVSHTMHGMMLGGQKPFFIQSWVDCRMANVTVPLVRAARGLEITHLIRGQRNADKFKAPSRNGDMVEGMIYLHPIEDWSDEQVLDFVSQHMEIPEHFKFSDTSLDCYDCPALLDYQVEKHEWAMAKHPELERVRQSRAAMLKEAISPTVKNIDRLL